MRTRSRRLSWVASCIAIALPAPVLAQQAASQSAPPAVVDDNRIQEVVVTARKREESLQQTPVAVTALGQDALRQIGATRLDDIAGHVPNLVLERDASSNAVGRIMLRGVGALNAGITNDPGVGLYLDGVLISRASGSLLDVLDTERVEVLRGPQGTLFGRNTVGGAINVITAKPGPGFSGFASASIADPAQGTVRGSVNLPLVDGLLYGRFSGLYTKSRGYSHNAYDDKYYDNVDRYALRGALRWTPTKDLTIDLTGDYSRDNSRGPGEQCRYVNLSPVPGFVGLINFVNFLATGQPFDFKAECNKTENIHSHNVNFDAAAVSKIESYGGSGVIDWSPGAVGGFDNLDVKAIFGIRHENPNRTADLDAMPFPIIHAIDLDPNKLNQYSAELQFTGDAMANHLHFVTGLYAFKEDGKTRRFTLIVPNVALIGLHFNAIDVQNIDNKAYAAYGQATYDFNEILSITGGLRYTDETKGFYKLRQTIGSNDPTGPVIATPTEASLSAKFNHWTGMANITLHAPPSWTDGTWLNEGMTYFTFSQGFKSGGFNGEGQTASGNLNKFNPETLNSYEIGVKLTAFDHHLVFDVAGFISDYNQIQVSVLTSDPVTKNIIQKVLNAGKARITGIEIESTLYPLPHLELSAAIGITHAKYLEFNSFLADGTPIDRSGEPFSRVPTFTSTLAAQYHFELGGAGTITPRIELVSTGERHFHSSPFPEAIKAFTQGGYSLLNARIAWDLPDDRTQIAIFGKNLGDKHYLNDGIEFADSLSIGLIYFGAPRTVGVELSHKF